MHVRSNYMLLNCIVVKKETEKFAGFFDKIKFNFKIIIN